MSAPTINTSIVLDSIDIIRENAQRIHSLLDDYIEQIDLRLSILEAEGNETELQRFQEMQERNDQKRRTASEVIAWTDIAFDDFINAKLGPQLTLSNTMLAGEMLRLIDPAREEPGA